MTRRRFLVMAPGAVVVASGNSRGPLVAPVNLVMDSRAKLRPEQIRYFWSDLWPEAARDLGRCGIQLQGNSKSGEVWRPPYREPVLTGLDRGVINVVITDQIPVQWDNGRAVAGVTTRYRGRHLSMIALNHAHCHQLPLLSVNTCLHELLHLLMHDVFEGRPKGLAGQARELRIDMYATRLWLFRDGAAIRKAAEVYIERLRSEPEV
jgi:hypothetical protein